MKVVRAFEMPSAVISMVPREGQTTVRMVHLDDWVDLRNALQAVTDAVPAHGEGGELFWVHSDGEGNEIGVEQVDPLQVIQNMQTISRDALIFDFQASHTPNKYDLPTVPSPSDLSVLITNPTWATIEQVRAMAYELAFLRMANADALANLSGGNNATALETYGQHTSLCGIRNYPKRAMPCTCGFAAALDAKESR